MRTAPNITIGIREDGSFDAGVEGRSERAAVSLEDVALLSRARRGLSLSLAVNCQDRIGYLSARGLLVRDEPDRDQSPIFVLGSPRSGTTLVRQILDSHPRISCGSESFFLSVFRDIFRNGRLRRPLLNYGVKDRDILELFRSFTCFVHGQLAARQGKARWADKTPMYSSMAEFIFDLFGTGARYLLVVRHGLDVARSMSQMVDDGHWDGNLAGFADGVRVAADHPVEAGARVWAQMSDSLHRFRTRHPDSVFVIRYEQLVAEPERVVNELFGHLNEGVPDGFLERLFEHELKWGAQYIGAGDPKLMARRTFDTSSVGKWKEMDPTLVRSLADIVNPMLAAWQYDPL
jgi:protein-tyrosine sulfotransferase